MKRLTIGFLPVVLLAARLASGADFETPGTGQTYTLTDLVAISSPTVTGSSPSFYLQGNLTIASSDTLQASAGETLVALAPSEPEKPGYYVEIAGRLNALGTQGAPVHFTASPETPGTWHGLVFTPTSTYSVMDHCKVEYATIGISCYGCDPAITNSTISHCLRGAIYAYGRARPFMQYNVITANPGAIGLFLCDPDISSFTNNTLTDNGTGLLLLDVPSTTSLYEVSLGGNAWAGLYCTGQTSSSISANTISSNDHGIIVRRSAGPQLLHNTIQNNYNAGMAITDDARPVCRGNTIQNNGPGCGGVTTFRSAQPDFGTAYQLGENTLRNNSPYDFANYSPNEIYAYGNTWTTNYFWADTLIYDDEEDEGDADGSGFVSGMVHFYSTDASNWQLYY
jgi:parallel beta-helix repeat protein